VRTTRPNTEQARRENEGADGLANNLSHVNETRADVAPTEEVRSLEEAGTNPNSPLSPSDGKNPVIPRNQSLSQKIMHFLSAKMNAVLPENSTANELAILEEGGMYVNSGENTQH